jgi:hypothetical protein
MPESRGGLRVVPPEPPPEPSPRRRTPGAAVLLVFLYAALFAAGLWWMKSKSPLFQRAKASAPASEAVPVKAQSRSDRDALRTGAGLIGAAREEYLRRIATECCACGCDLSLERCLAMEKTCPESPPRAAAIFEEMR